MKPTDRSRETDGLDWNTGRIRADFPILGRMVHGNWPLAYLDNAATTQKPTSVINGLCEYYRTSNANVHRSLHDLAGEATRQYDEARRKVAAFIGAADERTVIFTRGTTESVNLVAHGWGRKFIRAGDEILLTEMEHHSNLIPWQLLAREKQAVLRFVPIRPDGTLDGEAFHRLLSPRVRLAAFTHISNVLGTVNPVGEMTDAARQAGARVLIDAAQSVPTRPVNVRELKCDFLAFSGHKMLGPTGVGALYGRLEELEAMDPFMGGGEMIARVFPDRATWAEVPYKFEAGTPSIGDAIGLGLAVDYLTALDMRRVERRERELAEYAVRRLKAIPGVRVFGDAPDRGGAVSFAVEGIHPHDLAQFVDREGIAIRAGHLCAQPLMRKLGVPAVNRASFYVYSLCDEIDRLMDAIDHARRFFLDGNR